MKGVYQSKTGFPNFNDIDLIRQGLKWDPLSVANKNICNILLDTEITKEKKKKRQITNGYCILVIHILYRLCVNCIR